MVKKRRRWPIRSRAQNQGHGSAQEAIGPGKAIKPAQLTVDEQLELALTDCCSSTLSGGGPSTPDYGKFLDWYASADLALRENADAFNRVRRNQGGGAALLVAFCDTYTKYRTLCSKGSASKEPSKRLNDFSKFKLHLHVLKHLFSDRTREFVEAYAIECVDSRELDSSLEQCTQGQLRIRLGRALSRGQDKLAFKIIGRLRADSHDLGELDYLEAQAYFRSNDFSEAIRIGSNVPDHSIDYPAAQALLMEAHALLGNIEAVLSLLRTFGIDKMSSGFVVYLFQLLIYNALEPLKAVEAIGTLADCVKKPIEATSSDTFWPTLNRHSCKLATEYAEHIIQKQKHEEAMEQSGEPRHAELKEATDTEEQPEECGPLGEGMDPKEFRLFLALHSEYEFLKEVVGQPDGEMYVPIVKRLLNVMYAREFSDYKEAFLTQYRLGGGRAFVDNVIGMISESRPTTDSDNHASEKMELCELAFIEALANKHPGAQTLVRALEGLGATPRKIGELNIDARTKEITLRLSPMGQQAYESGRFMLEAAIKRDSHWQDAGMVSLGFFRILELELNHRLILPLRVGGVGGTVLNQVQCLLDEISEPVSDESNNGTKRRKKTIESWARVIPQLVNVLEGDKSGLELGSLYWFFEKTRNEEGIDAPAKAMLRELITKQLSNHGAIAFQSGKMSEMISPAILDTYRNPPAHTRFLPLERAIECKAYVDDCLQSLITWTTLATGVQGLVANQNLAG